ncbi:hypothetical protein JG687_00010111 [Phytophthora cactorum]|uniref:Uncharacterized protein n=1 Tax=Phytophthora cactorum TaxID=29920 RepID=A0A329RY31_9STRA|nr:hypothetical protein PC114_g10908 [Phytophthora cactorum]KAG2934594.1 hypothetical protein PC117_g12612 [Phytophthora cactorum]KAG3011461.1 hypothetical protein PC119_g13222 [Phytophthora cactorum]KAG3181609.1 hypothetical protein PC128_g15064 [Phytophthora cactorum]KAG3214076.1 hypothetical protein PC129_g15018 [Phytophthora cactorum]
MVIVAVVLRGHSNDLQHLRRQVHQLLVDAQLNRELKFRYRLTAACLGMPHLCVLSLLYKYGTDENFLNITTLTRVAFNEILARFAEFFFRFTNLNTSVGDRRR